MQVENQMKDSDMRVVRYSNKFLAGVVKTGGPYQMVLTRMSP